MELSSSFIMWLTTMLISSPVILGVTDAILLEGDMKGFGVSVVNIV